MIWKAAGALTPGATADAGSNTSRNVNKIIVLKEMGHETLENINVVGVSLRNVSLRKIGEATYYIDI